MHHVQQVPVGGGDDAHIHRDGAYASNSSYLHLLQDAEEMYLHLKGQVAHLVQKDGTLVGALKHAHLSLFAGPGEGPLLIAEQLALDQAGRDGAAVDADEALPGAGGVFVYVPRELLLAHAGLPQQQDRRVQGGHLLGPGQHLQRAGIGRHHAGDKPLVALQELHFGAAALLALLILPLQAVDLRHIPDHRDDHGDLPAAVKVGCAGDERLFAGAEGLLQRHRLSGLEHPQGAGAVNHAGSDNLLHAFAQHVLPPQAGDLLIGAVDQDRVGLSVRNVKSVIDAVQDRKELSVELPLASPQQRGVFSNENTLGLLHPSPPLLAFRQLLGTSPSSITMGMPHFPVINVSKRSSSAASRNAETGMIYAPCPK